MGGWGIKKFNLDDLYVRFFRLAERRIAEQAGRGIVCFISNFSHLGDPSFVVMRERFLREFDALWFDCMNGDSRETGKLTPDGKPDPSVFSTEYNREGIRVGTAVAVMVRKPHRSTQPTVRFRQFWGVTKRADLLESLKAKDFDTQYQLSNPDESNRFSFRPIGVSPEYLAWPKLVDLCAVPPSNGLMEKRGGGLFHIRKAVLEQRMRMYYDGQVDWETLQALGTGLTEDAAGFSAKAVRMKALAVEQYQPARMRRYALRPFDTRWCYYTDVSPVWNRCRPSLWAQCWEGNAFLLSRPAGVALPEGVPFFFTRLLGDNDFLRGHAYYIPMRLRPAAAKVFDALPEPQSTPTANLSPLARGYLTKIGIDDSGADAGIGELVWMHALAIGYSSAYLTDNADGIRQDWPRVPLPSSRQGLLASAQLGRQVAALLDTETPVPGVTSEAVRPELAVMAVVSRVGGGPLDPQGGDLALNAGWGHAGKGGVTMPGSGQLIRREYTPVEQAEIERGAKALGLSVEEAFLRLGTTTFDIYLNELAFWANVPCKVWAYTIGSYPVIKKWLSYRERDLLGRDLTPNEVREVGDIARRIAALVLLEPQLDANYEGVRAETYDWAASGTAS
jgi:hypothetical protein